MAFVEITRSNALEKVTENIPAARRGLTNVSGLATLALNGRNMPFGTNTFTVRLKDRLGNFSAPLVFQTVLGGNGQAARRRVVSHLANLSGAVSRPVGPQDRPSRHPSTRFVPSGVSPSRFDQFACFLMRLL